MKIQFSCKTGEHYSYPENKEDETDYDIFDENEKFLIRASGRYGGGIIIDKDMKASTENTHETMKNLVKLINSGKCKMVPVSYWKDNFEFEDELKITGIERGRSAAHFTCESTTTGKKYTLFMTDILKILNMTTVKNAKIKGVWTFCKRGSNYGITLIKEVL